MKATGESKIWDHAAEEHVTFDFVKQKIANGRVAWFEGRANKALAWLTTTSRMYGASEDIPIANKNTTTQGI